MWGKYFYWIVSIKEREVAVNLVCKHGHSIQIWHTFGFEYCQVIFRCGHYGHHLWKRDCLFPALSYHVQFHVIVVHVLGGTISFRGYLRCHFSFRFLPLLVTIGMESTMDMNESQSLGLNDCIMVSTSALNDSESMLKRVLNV